MNLEGDASGCAKLRIGKGFLLTQEESPLCASGPSAGGGAPRPEPSPVIKTGQCEGERKTSRGYSETRMRTHSEENGATDPPPPPQKGSHISHRGAGRQAGPPRTRSGVLPGTLTPSIKVSSSSRRKVPHAGGYSLSDSLRTCRATCRGSERNGETPGDTAQPHLCSRSRH